MVPSVFEAPGPRPYLRLFLAYLRIKALRTKLKLLFSGTSWTIRWRRRFCLHLLLGQVS